MKKLVYSIKRTAIITLMLILINELMPVPHAIAEVKFGHIIYSDAWETYKTKTYNIKYCYDIDHTLEYYNPVPLNEKYTSRTVQLKTRRGVMHLDGKAEVPFTITLIDDEGNIIDTYKSEETEYYSYNCVNGETSYPTDYTIDEYLDINAGTYRLKFKVSKKVDNPNAWMNVCLYPQNDKTIPLVKDLKDYCPQKTYMKKDTIKDYELTLTKKQKLDISANPGSNITGANTIHGIFNIVEILDSNDNVVATNRSNIDEWQSEEQYTYDGVTTTLKKGTYTIRVYAYQENDTMTLFIWD